MLDLHKTTLETVQRFMRPIALLLCLFWSCTLNHLLTKHVGTEDWEGPLGPLTAVPCFYKPSGTQGKSHPNNCCKPSATTTRKIPRHQEYPITCPPVQQGRVCVHAHAHNPQYMCAPIPTPTRSNAKKILGGKDYCPLSWKANLLHGQCQICPNGNIPPKLQIWQI